MFNFVKIIYKGLRKNPTYFLKIAIGDFLKIFFINIWKSISYIFRGKIEHFCQN